MGQYSIKDLEQLSGIKAHTIRIWEQRYDMFSPERSESNIRSYSVEDLKTLLNIALLKNNGFKISKVASMERAEIKNKVKELSENPGDYSDQAQALTVAMLDLDEESFEKVMSTSILKLGFENTMLHIIQPFLNNVGILWLTGTINPAQEHFISNLIRQKIIVTIDGQHMRSNDNSKKYMLFLPDGELHELSLLFANYIVRSRNNKSVYLGQSLPMHDVKAVYDIQKPDYLVTIITSNPGQDKIQAFVDNLGLSFPSATILLSGRQIIGQGIELADNMIVFNQPSDLISFVEEDSLSIV